MSEIALTRCVVNPYFGGDLCAPDSTIEQDAIKGKWVRVPRNLNWEGNYGSGWLVSIRSIHIPMLNAPHNLVGDILSKNKATRYQPYRRHSSLPKRQTTRINPWMAPSSIIRKVWFDWRSTTFLVVQDWKNCRRNESGGEGKHHNRT